jgi:hypothetical protein
VIGRRRPQPQPQPPAERISFTARPWTPKGPAVPELRSDALSEARKFFGPDYELEITGPWTAAKDADGYGYRAEITVTATPRSAK